MERESETIEWKEVVVDDIKKEVIAFANGEGGTLYIGVRDDGTVAGVDDPDGCTLQVANMVRDAIRPDVTMFVHYRTETRQGKPVVAVTVQSGTGKPYYLARKGLRPEGVFVRQGSASVPATDTAIRRMIKQTDGDRFESMRSLQQELTFAAAAAAFADRGLPFGAPQMQSLHLCASDGLYTNLGLLLSDQCPHTIKAAVFSGTDQSQFQDRREFSGSLLRQLEEVYAFIDLHNQTRATFSGLRRTDTRDYPETALREALLNALVHRDYAYHASTLVSLYQDRIEMVSVGGLLPGLDLEDVMMGLSLCRNEHLANVFYRLQLIEAYGTGMGKILASYRGQAQIPRIECTANAFKVVLPNRNAGAHLPEDPPAASGATDAYGKAVLDRLRERPAITRAEVETLLGVGTATAYRVLKQLQQQGCIRSEGRGKNTVYHLI